MPEVPLEQLVARLLDQPEADAETLLLLLSAGSLLGIVSLLGRARSQEAAERSEVRTPPPRLRPAAGSGGREERRKGEGPVVRWGRGATATSAAGEEGTGTGRDVS